MKIKALITALLLAVVKMVAMADILGPTHHYHALSYPEWLATKAGLPNGVVLGVLISLGLIILNYIRVRRKSDCTFLLFMRKHWASNLTICLLCLVGCIVRYVVAPAVQQGMAMMGGRVDISVEPSPAESYFQYRERSRRLENDLCIKCGTMLEHWYFEGRHSGCPHCDKLYGACKECGKAFKRFNRGRHGISAQEGTNDPNELCDACIESHGIRVF